MRLKYTAAWVGFTAAATVAVSACGSGGVKTATSAVNSADKIMAVLSRATDRTDQLGSAEVRMSTDTGTGTPVTLNGTYSWGDGVAVDVLMDTKAANMQALQHRATIRALFVKGAYYYNVDPQTSGPLKGKQWMKVDASVLFGSKGAQDFDGGSAGNPVAAMKYLKYAKDVKDLGKETVDGQRTTRYRAVVHRAEMGKYKDVFSSDGMKALTGGSDSVTMDVWIGAKDLPVRLKDQFGKATVTMDFKKFGATAPVKAPPAGQTADLTKAIENSRKQQG
ncbi:hypothetical protein [Streptomyces sp. Ag109_O5-10]|uniref:hypothetical protein n=1 Tax=Streptomyces sp. Ag109_O5-10 TaxID=1855349 RepID=UPI0008999CB8|nr:hypothetical protein [Streptomyces sp. Ag109_O5-10]SEF04943.1 hypothetical protein SAMN05216533_5552 [Streptomyces sp. Ag109_O5-10]